LYKYPYEPAPHTEKKDNRIYRKSYPTDDSTRLCLSLLRTLGLFIESSTWNLRWASFENPVRCHNIHYIIYNYCGQRTLFLYYSLSM